VIDPRDDAGGDTELARDPRGERQAVVIDAFDPTLSFRDAKERAIGAWERWYVAALLRHTGGNLSEAARVAHSDRSHLRKLVRKHLRSAITPP
jgi:DNA-binding NtrC family response regulator